MNVKTEADVRAALDTLCDAMSLDGVEVAPCTHGVTIRYEQLAIGSPTHSIAVGALVACCDQSDNVLLPCDVQQLRELSNLFANAADQLEMLRTIERELYRRVATGA